LGVNGGNEVVSGNESGQSEAPPFACSVVLTAFFLR
jgi:hypothetical protein